LVHLGEKFGEEVQVQRGQFGGAGNVDLDAVAGAEQDRLAAEASGEFVQGAGSFGWVKRQLFTQLHIGGAKATTDNRQMLFDVPTHAEVTPL
jgi:hypothetical protein